MALYVTKPTEVEARQYEGEALPVVSDKYGEQTAVTGDYLVGTEKGSLHVMPQADFEAMYQPVQVSS